MARSSFRLPNIQELSKQQRNALDLPLDGQHLIVGGPGTGKSVVALLRARRLANEKKKYLFLVYNVLLDKNSYGLGGSELRADTWKKWFKNTFHDWYGCDVPTVGDGNENWGAILGIEPLPNIDTSLYLIIDEGQDMPREFYEVLVKIGFDKFYVVADQNQRITEHNSSRQDIEEELLISTADTLELTSNYRNSLPIARLAQAFFTNDPASPLVELPEAGAGDRIPQIMKYGANSERDFIHIVTQILSAYDRNIDKLICVITSDDEKRNRFCAALENATLPRPLDYGMPNVQTYSSNVVADVDDNLLQTKSGEKCPYCGADMIIKNGRYGPFVGCSNWPDCDNSKSYAGIDFRNGGIAVINQQSIKGLEFDTVYIADIDSFWGRTRDELMKKFYVMISRARDDVILLRTGVISPDVEQIIPADETILERR